MSIATAKWFLWVSLMVLLPWPILVITGHDTVWSVSSGGQLLQSLLDRRYAPMLSGWHIVALLVQVLLAGLLLWGIAIIYGRSSLRWPIKIRGSIVGLCVLTLLITFSTFTVYQPWPQQQPISFLELYQ